MRSSELRGSAVGGLSWGQQLPSGDRAGLAGGSLQGAGGLLTHAVQQREGRSQASEVAAA